MPTFSRDNPYHRSLASANTPTARRNVRTPYVSFSVARVTLSPRVTSSLLVTPAAPQDVFSPQPGGSGVPGGLPTGTRTFYSRLDDRDLLRQIRGTFTRLTPAARRHGSHHSVSLFDRVQDRQDPSSSAWYRLGPRRSGPLWVIRQCHPPKRAGGETARTFDECPPAGSNL